MEDAFTIGNRLREEALRAREQNLNDASWQMLRSDIYVRDKGICWICNTFVELKDYDLGHLIDRCNNGSDTYDNLSVMHKSCNLSKPKHTTLEEAMKWKLTPKYLTERPISMFDSSKSIGNGYPYSHEHKKKNTNQLSLELNKEREQANKELISSYTLAHPELTDTVRLEAIKLLSQILNMPEKSVKPIIANPDPLPQYQPTLQNNDTYIKDKYTDIILNSPIKLTPDNLLPMKSPFTVHVNRKHVHLLGNDKIVAKELVIEYFKTHPELLLKENRFKKSDAIKALTKDLNLSIEDVREWIIEANLIPKKVIHCDGSQYSYIKNNFDILKQKYDSKPHTTEKDKCNIMGLTNYQMQIFYFFNGQQDKINRKNLHGIINKIRFLKYKGTL